LTTRLKVFIFGRKHTCHQSLVDMQYRLEIDPVGVVAVQIHQWTPVEDFQ
jgi:hypothetical protein